MQILSRALQAFFFCVLAAWISGCTGVIETRLASRPDRAPLATKLVVLIDSDVIGAAFASYRGTVPLASKSADYQGFIDNLKAGTIAEAKAAGIDAHVEVVSLKALRSGARFPSSGEPVLVMKALSFTRRLELIGNRDLGWSGDTAWDFSLSEKMTGSPYRQTWSATTQHENLNPFLCGNYADCSKALVSRVFSQMRKDGILR
ncbi:MAG: hypothetical protein Q7T70_13430 [Polaromonas sp.]|nr:hypothetical protein [Polaromonas sp.]